MTCPRQSTTTKVLAIGSKKQAATDSPCSVMGICFTVFAFCFESLISYKVMRLLVTTTKLKSSPMQKENKWIFWDFVN